MANAPIPEKKGGNTLITNLPEDVKYATQKEFEHYVSWKGTFTIYRLEDEMYLYLRTNVYHGKVHAMWSTMDEEAMRKSESDDLHDEKMDYKYREEYESYEEEYDDEDEFNDDEDY